jgi:hypothetical protein
MNEHNKGIAGAKAEGSMAGECNANFGKILQDRSFGSHEWGLHIPFKC